MDVVQRAHRFAVVGFVMLVGLVCVFGRNQSARWQQTPANNSDSPPPLVLRSNYSLSVPERPAANNQKYVPIPDTAVPIEWERVRPERTQQRLPVQSPRPDSPREPFHQNWRPAERDPWTPRSGDRLPDAGQPQRQFADHPAAPPVRYHRIVDGETLKDIAARYLGTPDRFMELFYANRAVLPHPDVLPLGARLIIPDKTARVPAMPQAPQYLPPTEQLQMPRQQLPTSDWQSR